MSPDWSASPTGVPYATITNPQSLNLYAYVGNDPIDGQDPDGHARYGILPSAHSTQNWDPDDDWCDYISCIIQSDQNSSPQKSSNSNATNNSAAATTPASAQQQVPMSTTTYKTATGAGKAALDAIIGQSEKSGWEYAGRIVKLENGRYAYTLPTTMKSNNTSDFDGGMPEGTRIPAGTTNAGMYHTHPTGGGSNPDLFSGADNSIAVREHLPSYMESGATRSIYLLDGSKRTSILDPTPPTVIRYGPPQ